MEDIVMADATLDMLAKHPWPGNVRELRNAVQRAVVLCPDDVIQPDQVEPDLDAPRRGGRDGADSGIRPGRTLDECEKELILKTLDQTDGNKTAAAEILQVTPRTLRNKLQRYAAEAAD